MRSKGEPGDRMYDTCDPNVRAFDDDVAENSRQAKYARSTIGPDGEHWIPEQTCSLEEMERTLNEIAFRDPPKPPKVGGFWRTVHDIWTAIFSLGMYSSDPTIARIGEIQTIRRQVIPAYQDQRAGDQARVEAQRVADQAGEERRMRMLAKAMIDEMEARQAQGRAR